MPTLGAPELIIILVIIILIFGVGKLPEVGQALGKSMREFRGAAEGVEEKDEVRTAEKPRPAPAVEAPRTAPAAQVVDAPRPVAAAPAPVAPAPAAAGATVAYTVADGDTLDSIATSHGITVETLMAANGYSQRDRVLYAGDKIQVPQSSKIA